ncbi:hypothetical protein NP493_86g02013 [Ridgeia piscesae]|uniref:Uncharacterized protein n=1 Tax=Ridgeia piscesae TaxID=27915 RepID=A0AAD9P8K2_RIDPI|nr:hypothetical protein NP493_86g02013 [Ridgeia piscesae]
MTCVGPPCILSCLSGPRTGCPPVSGPTTDCPLMSLILSCRLSSSAALWKLVWMSTTVFVPATGVVAMTSDLSNVASTSDIAPANGLSASDGATLFISSDVPHFSCSPGGGVAH